MTSDYASAGALRCAWFEPIARDAVRIADERVS